MIDFNFAVQGATITGGVLILAEDVRRVLDKAQVELNTANERIAGLEKSGNEMAIIIADLRAHLKIRGK